MKKSNRKLLTVLVASGIIFNTISYSTAFAADNTDFQLDQVTVTASKFKQSVANAPVTVTVVTSKEIEQKGAKNLGDALQGVAGVNIMSEGGLNSLQRAFINGSERVVYLVDGKRINIPQGIAKGDSGFDLGTFIAMENIDRIEIVSGGGSALYGADAVGGVINIITKKGSGKMSTIVDTEFGSNNLRTYRIANSGSEKGWSWFLNGNKQSTDGQRDNDYFDGKSFAGRIDRELSKTENLTFTYDYVGSSKGLPGSLIWGTSATDYGDINRNNWGLAYNKKENGRELTLRYYDNNQVYSGDNGGTFNHENRVQAIEFETNFKADAKNTVSWGGQWLKERVISTGESDSRDRIVKAIFLQDEYKWDDKWAMTSGLRYDNNSQYGTNWLPKVAFSYQADAKTGYFVNWGRVFRAPSFDALYWDDAWMSGNPDLKPEKGWIAQIGMKKKLNTNNELMISVFKQQLSDAIRWNDTWTTTENIDNLEATGLNFSYNTRYNDKFSTSVSYTYNDSHKADGTSIGQPYNTLSVGMKYKEGKYSQSLYSYYIDESGTGTSEVSSHVIWNTNINYKLDKDTSIYMNGVNLFNKKYQPVSGYPGQERTISFGLKKSF